MTAFEQFHGDLVNAASDQGKLPPLLIAVSKKQSLEKMRLVYEQGQRHFGENYAQELAYKDVMKRVKKNDPVAARLMGNKHYDEGDYENAFKYLTKAAELGDAHSHFELSTMYYEGNGVEKDKEKEDYHLEEAAIGGHAEARHDLGCAEAGTNRRFERARKHFIIAANLGYEGSLKMVKHLHTIGHASKQDYAAALRAYQAAVVSTKSAEREKAQEAIKNGEMRRSNTATRGK